MEFNLDAESLLVLGAHPDDAVLGAGGLLALAASAGTPAFILTMTAGERGGDPAIRTVEEIAAARVLGAGLEFADLPDTAIELHAAIDRIDAAIRRIHPQTVLVHAPEDSHQDHVCLSRAAISACRLVPNLLFYEGPSSKAFCPSMLLDITRVWGRKRRAIRSHCSQVRRVNVLEWAGSTSRFRAWPRYPRARCEGFVPDHCDAAAFACLKFDGESPTRAPAAGGAR